MPVLKVDFLYKDTDSAPAGYYKNGRTGEVRQLMSVADAAKKWGMSASRVRLLAQKGRIDGAFMAIVDGRYMWLFPKQGSPDKQKRGRKAHENK